MTGYIDGLEDGVVAADEAAFTTMRHQVARLRRLASDLREAAAASEHALHLAPVASHPADLLRVAAASAGPGYLAKDVTIAAEDGGPDLPMVSVDPDRMQQVLANLLDNALRHTPPGGSVRLAATAGSAAAPGSHDQVTITLSDSGDGIPAAELEAVFERFHRVAPARPVHGPAGSGLGLTIARAIVRDHGGELRATSAGPGAGATFTITLPAAPGG